MSILIGIQFDKGALLFTDSINNDSFEKGETHQRIQSALYPLTFENDALIRSGLFYASSRIINNIHKDIFCRKLNLADLLSDEIFKKKHDVIPGGIFDKFAQEVNDTYPDDKDKYLNIKKFINSADFGDYALGVLRISENFSPDLLEIKEGVVKKTGYVIIGDRETYDVKNYLDKRLINSQLPTRKIAFDIAINAMNLALSKQYCHRGYNMVDAEINNGVLSLRTARDDSAQVIELEKMIDIGQNFERYMQSSKVYTFRKEPIKLTSLEVIPN